MRKKNAGPAGDKKSGRGGKSVKGSGDGQPGKVDQMGNRAERADMEGHMEVYSVPTAVSTESSI